MAILDPVFTAPSIGPRPPGSQQAEVRVWNDPGQNGNTFACIDQDCPYVGDKFNDQISSIVVTSGTWRFWENANYGGRSLVGGPGEVFSDLRTEPGNFNDMISSIQLTHY